MHGTDNGVCGLRSPPDCRSRRALLHLSYSCIPPCGPAILVTQDPKRSSGPHDSDLPHRAVSFFIEAASCWPVLRAIDLGQYEPRQPI